MGLLRPLSGPPLSDRGSFIMYLLSCYRDCAAIAVQVCLLTDNKSLAAKARAIGLKVASMQVW